MPEQLPPSDSQRLVVAQKAARWTALSDEDKLEVINTVLQRRPKGSFNSQTDPTERLIAASELVRAVDYCVTTWAYNGEIPSDEHILDEEDATPTPLDDFLGRVRRRRKSNFTISSLEGSIPFVYARAIEEKGVQRSALETTVLSTIRTIRGYIVSDDPSIDAYLARLGEEAATKGHKAAAYKDKSRRVGINPSGRQRHTHGNSGGPVPNTHRTTFYNPSGK